MVRYLAALWLALAFDVPHAPDVEERRAVASLPAHIAATFEEIAACHISTSGEYVIFDRRAHAVYTVARGADAPTRILQIGSESGRIIMPTAFDSLADGTFVVADAPGDYQRLQFFLPSGAELGGFRLPGRGTPRFILGNASLSALASLEFTGDTVLMSQPDVGALVTEYQLSGNVLRTFGELRATGQEKDPLVHIALNVGITLHNPKGGYYFVFLSGVPAYRKYNASGTLLFERHIEGVEMDPYVGRMPTTWPRRREGGTEMPIVAALVRTAAVDSDGNLWISLVAPYTYVYDPAGDRRRTLQFRGAGIIAPTHFDFTRDRRVIVSPGCYTFSAE
jgi:hypothetical protein